MATRNAPPIVLIHGMWMTSACWDEWVDRYRAAGYRVAAPSWPGLESGVRALQRDPSPLANLGMDQIVDHYRRIIRSLDAPPILIGHSFGGSVVQLLLDRGLGAAGVAIHSYGVKGVYALPLSTIRCIGHFLANPLNARRPLPFTPEKFHYAFTNTLSRRESDEVYRRLHVPGAGRASFQGALMNLSRSSPLTVDFSNDRRPPLLFISGELDQLLPPAMQRENVRRWSKSGARTEYREYPGRSHYTLGQEGWEEVADFALEWAEQAAGAGAMEPELHPPHHQA